VQPLLPGWQQLLPSVVSNLLSPVMAQQHALTVSAISSPMPCKKLDSLPAQQSERQYYLQRFRRLTVTNWKGALCFSLPQPNKWML